MISLKIAEKEIYIQPTLALIECLENDFGPLTDVVMRMKASDFQLREHVKMVQAVWAHAGQPLKDAEVETLLEKEGVLGLAQMNLKILAMCLNGLKALESFFQEVPAGLGKSLAAENTI